MHRLSQGYRRRNDLHDALMAMEASVEGAFYPGLPNRPQGGFWLPGAFATMQPAIGGANMFDWLRKLLVDFKAQGTLLELLEQQASAAREQLNESLSMAHESLNPEAKVSCLEFAKSKFAELQAIAAEHPRMRLTNEKEIDAAIKQMEVEFARAGYYAKAKQSASVHVELSPRAKELLR